MHRRTLLPLMPALFLALSGTLCSAATLVVDSTGDGLDINPGDGICVAAGGACTLRAAIDEANAIPNGSEPDAIHFDVAGAGTTVIVPGSALPQITEAVVIDGYTQPGASENTLAQGSNAVVRIMLDGTGAGAADGLDVLADDVTIRGLALCGWARATPGDLGRGIRLQGARGVVEGCFIGTDVSGSLAIANAEAGVRVDGADGRIGGDVPAARNVISGNVVAGVDVTGPRVRIVGNLIGVDLTGNSRVQNGRGVRVIGADAVIGEPAAPNVISGNGSFGVQILAGGDGAMVLGNMIGPNVTGAVDRGNGSDGILVQNAVDVVIGEPGAGNVVSGNNRNGIALDGATGARVVANLVGTDVTGTSDVGNGNEGILVDADDVWIEGNVVAFSAGDGVALPPATATGVRITANRIFENGNLGIDLESNGVTANDAGDGDIGSNGRQNFPVLATASSDGITTDVSGTLESLPGLTYRIEIFANTECDTSDYGEAERFLGGFDVTTDGAGFATFDTTVPAPVIGGTAVTATATDPSGSTSELSACIVASGPATTTTTTTTTSSTLPGSSTTTTVTGGSTTTTTAPIPCVDASVCGDGDACTVDACVGGFCAWTVLTQIPGVVCHVTNVRGILEETVCSGCGCRFDRRLAKIEAKYARATATPRRRACKRNVGGGRRQARRFERKVNKLVRKECLGPIDPMTALVDESSDLARAAETLVPNDACSR